MSIERLGLETDFGNELALEERLETLRVGGFGLGEHALVNELVNGWGFHLVKKAVVCAKQLSWRQ